VGENTFLRYCPNSTEIKFVCVPYDNTLFRFWVAMNCNPNRVLFLNDVEFSHVLVRLTLQSCYIQTASVVNMTMFDGIRNIQELHL